MKREHAYLWMDDLVGSERSLIVESWVCITQRFVSGTLQRGFRLDFLKTSPVTLPYPVRWRGKRNFKLVHILSRATSVELEVMRQTAIVT